MLRSFFTIAWRNLRKNRTYALINVSGLSLGIACGLLIYALVGYHLSFDDFHAGKDRIYRVVTEFHDEIADYSQGVPSPLGKAFRKDFDYAEAVARVVDFNNDLITFADGSGGGNLGGGSNGDRGANGGVGGGVIRKFEEPKGIAYAEPAFFGIFNFPLLEGDRTTALQHPGQALITERLAKKYFGEAHAAMGRVIRIDNVTDFAIVGILKDIPVNSDRQQEIYLSYDDVKDKNRRISSDSSWGSIYSQCMCFVRLRPSVTVAQADSGLARMGRTYQKGRDAQTTIFRLQPLSDIHFNPDFDGYVDKKYLWALFFIGVFIVLTACVNFINLATAQALNRCTEVGIRKVLGGLRTQLFWQFVLETAFIAVLAAVIAYGLSLAALPAVNSLFRSAIGFDRLGSLSTLAFLLGLLVVVIFLSGSYPGVVLSRFRPAAALKSRLSQKETGSFSIRRALVVTQFAISQLLIIGTIVIAAQLHFVKDIDMGFDKDAIVMVPLPGHDPVKLRSMRTQLEQIAGVRSVSLCYSAPASESNNSTNLRFDHRAEDEHWEVNTKKADDRYLRTFGLKLVAGRDLFPADTAREFVINETMVRRLDLASATQALGRSLRINKVTGPIVGVVRDFHNSSLRSSVAPIAIFSDINNYDRCAVKITPAHIHSSLAAIEKIWNGAFPDYLYSYRFLDDSIAAFYEFDTSLMNLIGLFAVIAVFIGCLGLYGLTAFMAVRKTREIGVRKVLGAGIPGILWLFGREFSRLVLVAFLIAAPAAWLIMHQYLQDFKYRITLGPGVFALAMGVTMVIVVLTVGWRSMRAALANPVRALRSE
ncbi:MAG TPA: ABC transporter permease [Puia sp.]|jgi:ABC-type antimicrobial peptide transport system permease subunit|nr:ABC transporter permease [Puia sp.]